MDEKIDAWICIYVSYPEASFQAMSQGVAYLHSWYNPATDAGNFYFYPNGLA
jgi:hypothetical protein